MLSERNPKDVVNKFSQALSDVSYVDAAIIFCGAHNFEFGIMESLIEKPTIPNMIEYICKNIQSQVCLNIELISVLFSHMRSVLQEFGEQFVNSDLCYVHLCAKMNYIDNWTGMESVEFSFYGRFRYKASTNSKMIHAVENLYPRVVEYLISKKLVAYPENPISHFNIFQALKNALTFRKDLSELPAILKLFILHDRFYLAEGNSPESHFLHYLKWIKGCRFYPANTKVVAGEIRTLLLDNLYSFNKFSLFCSGSQKNESGVLVLPDDVCYAIGGYISRL